MWPRASIESNLLSLSPRLINTDWVRVWTDSWFSKPIYSPVDIFRIACLCLFCGLISRFRFPVLWKAIIANPFKNARFVFLKVLCTANSQVTATVTKCKVKIRFVEDVYPTQQAHKSWGWHTVYIVNWLIVSSRTYLISFEMRLPVLHGEILSADIGWIRLVSGYK